MFKKSILLGLAGIVFTASNSALADEPYCREFTKLVQVGGKTQEAYGYACMQPDGSWQMLSDGTSANPYDSQNITYVTEPVRYVQQREVYYSPYRFVLSIGGDGWRYSNHHYRHDNGRHRGWYKKHYKHHHDHDDNRGRGRGW